MACGVAGRFEADVVEKMKQPAIRRWYGELSARLKHRDNTQPIEAEVSHSSVAPLPTQRPGEPGVTGRGPAYRSGLAPSVLPSATLTRRTPTPPAAADPSRSVDLETTVILPAFAASVAYRRARREDVDATVVLPPL